MTAEQLLSYGIVWDPINKVDLRVTSYDLFDTFYDNFSVMQPK